MQRMLCRVSRHLLATRSLQGVQQHRPVRGAWGWGGCTSRSLSTTAPAHDAPPTPRKAPADVLHPPTGCTHAVCEVVGDTGGPTPPVYHIGVVEDPHSLCRKLQRRGVLTEGRTFRITRGVTLSGRKEANALGKSLTNECKAAGTMWSPPSLDASLRLPEGCTHAICEVVDASGVTVYEGICKNPAALKWQLQTGVLTADRTFRVVRGVTCRSAAEVLRVRASLINAKEKPERGARADQGQGESTRSVACHPPAGHSHAVCEVMQGDACVYVGVVKKPRALMTHLLKEGVVPPGSAMHIRRGVTPGSAEDISDLRVSLIQAKLAAGHALVNTPRAAPLQVPEGCTHVVCEVVDANGVRISTSLTRHPSVVRRNLLYNGVLTPEMTFRVVDGVALKTKAEVSKMRASLV